MGDTPTPPPPLVPKIPVPPLPWCLQVMREIDEELADSYAENERIRPSKAAVAHHFGSR